jgi:hypothetical protein
MEIAMRNNIVSNPDFWDKETLLRLIDLAYSGTHKKYKRYQLKLLRRIPQFRSMLDKLIGAEKKHVEPKTTAYSMSIT